MRLQIQKAAPYAVIGFSTTADAMAAERLFQQAALSARLIPMPRELSAGCGMGIAVAPSDRAAACALLADAGIRPDGVCESVLRPR